MRIRAAVGLGVVAALGAAACGSDKTRADPLHEAIKKSRATPSYGFDVVTRFRSRGRTIVARGHGAGDRSSVSYAVRFPLGNGETATTRTIIDGRNGRLVDYVSNPAPELANGKHWLKFDRIAQMRGLGLEPSDVPGTRISNPARAVEALDAAHADIEKIGSATVRGVATTHYRARLDRRKLVQAAPAAKRKAVRRFFGRDLGVSVVHLWIDDDGVVRRMRQRVRGVVTTITFRDWGAPFTLHVPPPSDVSDETKP